MKMIAIRMRFTGQNLCHHQFFIRLGGFFHPFHFQTDCGESFSDFFGAFGKFYMTAEPIQRDFHFNSF